VFTKNILATDIVGPWLTIGDLDGDGRNDIIATPDGGTEAYLFRASATGGFAARTTLLSGLTKSGGVFLEDINADGLNDVLVGDYGADTLYWYINQGNAVLGEQRSVATGDGGSIAEVVDLDQDGVKDLLILEYNSGQISWNRGLGNGTFGSRVVIPSSFDGPYAIVSSDFDLDGDRDIAVATYSNTAMLAWLPNRGDGTFDPQLLISTSTGQTSMLSAGDFDRDGDNDLAVGSFSAGAVQFIENKLEEFATEIVQPATGTYLLGQHLDVQVHIGYPVVVTGVPSIGIQVGNRTLVANYLSGTGTPTLTFRYTVVQQDVDSDGVQLSGNSIRLNGGTLIDPFSGNAPTQLPTTSFVGVFVNGDAPFVKSIERLDPQVTNAPTVRFAIRFNEPVTSVDAADLTLVMHDEIVGATIRSVTGSGSVWMVEVATGSNSGTIGVQVKPSATISDLGGQTLGAGYAGGQVYTLRRSPTRVIDDYYTSGHGDLGPKMDGGHLELGVAPDGFEFENDEVLIYGNADALTPRPNGSAFDFIGVGAGENFYYWANNGTVASLPELGISGEGIAGGTFARITVTDPRVNNTAAFFKFQMIDVRSQNGGHVSVFNLGLGDPVVWMASSDGLTASDAMWLQEGSHQHFDFGFSKSGIYEVDFVTSGFRDVNGNGFYDEGIDPYIESGVETIYFGIDLAGGAQPYTIPAAMDGRAPVASDDPFQVVSGSSVKGNVLANDRDPQRDPMELLLHTAPLHGDFLLNSDGSFVYTPLASFSGSDSFRYWVRDNRGGYAIGNVSIEAAGPLTGTLLSDGEVDLGVAFEEGSWDLHLHDEGNDVEYEPGEAVIDVKPSSLVTRTGPFANEAFDFLGVANGNVFYVLPQSENTDLVYLGFGAEELAEGIFVGDAIRLRLASVSGPGHFSIWLDGATSTTPSLVMASSDGIRANDEYVVNAGSHAHINFGFTQAGTYKVAFVATGVLASDGSTTTSEIVTYTFRIGSEPLVDHEILIAPRSAARAGRPLQMDVQIAGMPTGGSNRYTYRFDLDGNGTIDRVVQSAANPMILSDVVYTTSGSRIIHVTAEDALGVVAEGRQTLHVSPAPAGDAANWMTSLDIDRDGQINALDVLAVVNHINQFGAGNAFEYRFLLDVDRGGDIGALDVLMLVNNINAGSGTDLLPFETLVMNNTGAVDGFTHSLAISGKIRGASRQLWLSHNEGDKKNASQFVQSDGSFQLTDAAIIDLFGDLEDGGHLFTAAIENESGFSMTMDRYVIKDSVLPDEFEIQSLLQTNSMLEVKWTSAGNDVVYDVWSKKVGAAESLVRSRYSSHAVNLALAAGEYDIWIEAIDGASNKRRTATTRVTMR
jgi:surface-anchored protein